MGLVLVGHPDGSVERWWGTSHVALARDGTVLTNTASEATAAPPAALRHRVEVGRGEAVLDQATLTVTDARRRVVCTLDDVRGTAIVADADWIVVLGDPGALLVDAHTCVPVAAGGFERPNAAAIAGDRLWLATSDERIMAVALPTFAPAVDRVRGELCPPTLHTASGCPSPVWSQTPHPTNPALLAARAAWLAGVPPPLPIRRAVPETPVATEIGPPCGYGLPIRPDRPTLVLVAPAGKALLLATDPTFDVLVIGDPGEFEVITPRNSSAFQDARTPWGPTDERRQALLEPLPSPRLREWGLREGEGVLLAPGCAVLAQGPAPTVVDAARALSLVRLPGPMPNHVAEIRWTRGFAEPVRGIPQRSGATLWLTSDRMGLIGPHGEDTWSRERLGVPFGTGRHVWVAHDGGMDQLDLKDGTTRRRVDAVEAIVDSSDDAVLVRVALGEFAVIDAGDGTVRYTMSARSAEFNDAGDLLVVWGSHDCRTDAAGVSLGCRPRADRPRGPTLPAGGASLPLTDDRWLAAVGSPDGPVAVVDAHGALLAWSPTDFAVAAGKHAVGSATNGLVAWEIP